MSGISRSPSRCSWIGCFLKYQTDNHSIWRCRCASTEIQAEKQLYQCKGSFDHASWSYHFRQLEGHIDRKDVLYWIDRWEFRILKKPSWIPPFLGPFYARKFLWNESRSEWIPSQPIHVRK